MSRDIGWPGSLPVHVGAEWRAAGPCPRGAAARPAGTGRTDTRALLLPPRPPGGGPGSQDRSRRDPSSQSWGAGRRRGAGRAGAWRTGGGRRLRVQGAQAAPGKHQTGIQATSPVQPRVAAAARAAANRSRQRASDRPGLGTCRQEGRVSPRPTAPGPPGRPVPTHGPRTQAAGHPDPRGHSGSARKPELAPSELLIGYFVAARVDWPPDHPPSPRWAERHRGTAKRWGHSGDGARRKPVTGGRAGGRAWDVPWQGAAGDGGARGLAPPAGTGPEPRPGGHLAGERRDR